jgi:hypothetical protein
MDILKNVSVACTYEVDITYDSDKFIKLKLRIMHDGINPNNSNFTLENIDKAKPSIVNIPILAYCYFDEEGNPQFSTHAMHLEVDKVNKEEIRMIYDEVPIGLVPETNNYEVKEYNDRNYVFADCFIWKNYSNYSQDVIERDKEIKLSMEIAVDAYNYNEELNCFDITDYRYTGITLLGNDVGTGMLDAKATTSTFSLNEKKEKMVVLMQELKDELAIKYKQFSQEGGHIILTDEIKNKVLAEFSLKIEDLDFEITDEMTEETFREAVNKFVENKEKPADSPEVTFSATYRQKREALDNAFDPSIVRDLNGNVIEETYYWVDDFDDTYVYVEMSHWVLENYERKNGRCNYAFDDSTLTATITSEFEEMVNVWLTIEENASIQAARASYEVLTGEFEEYKLNYSTPNTEVVRLQNFEKDTIDKKYETDVIEVFNKFDKQLNGISEYETLKTNYTGIEVDTIEEKCFAMLGKKNASFSAKQKDTVVKLPIDHKDYEIEDPYGGLLSRKYK